ncbi:MAG: hydrogenase maturation protein [Burkholderiales bacterium]
MRVLVLTHAYNGLAQRLHAELARLGHEVSVELDIADAVTAEAVEIFGPDVVVAPFLKRAIPASVWRRVPCLVVHPGIPGDRGPSSLDWAILERESDWGVTVLQANEVMDGGDVWASRGFPMREASKGSLYRREVTECAVAAVVEALDRMARGERPVPHAQAAAASRGRARPPVRQADRSIDWTRDTTADVLRKIRSADGSPGVFDRVDGVDCRLFDAHPEGVLRGAPGAWIARREEALCRATVDGAVWIGHVRRALAAGDFKRPAALALPEIAGRLADDPLPSLPARDASTWQDIAYEESGAVGVLRFDFYNGAMSTRQCERLARALEAAARRPTRVVVLAGGADFWSNGIHLNTIEAAASPADESWANIQAIDDLARAIIECATHLTIAALGGNAGAGGVFLALAADRVVARDGIVLNPHYKNMGNLYGSEYWTYLLPARVGASRAREITEGRLPMLAAPARASGLVDEVAGPDPVSFEAAVLARARALAAPEAFAGLLAAKRERRQRDEAAKPLEAYRAEELGRMRMNFYGFDPSYHVARYHFVHRVPHAWTPLHLARHRRRTARATIREASTT